MKKKNGEMEMRVRRERAIAILLASIFLLPLILVPTSADAAITKIVDEYGNQVEAGVYDDTLYVRGEGVTAGVEVNLYWDAVTSWDGEKGLLTSEEAEADGSFEIEFNVPEAVYGDHYLWVKDTDTGSIARSPDPFVVDARLKLTPRSGLPGDDITMRGYGFGDEVEIVYVTFGTEELTTSPRSPETDELGTWVAHFTVPDVPYDDYEVNATDEEGVLAIATFTVGAYITLDPEEGPVGTVVEVAGWGFVTGYEIVTITIDGNPCKIIGDIDIDDGEFQGEFVIPSYDLEAEEEYDVVVTDDYGWTADEEFEVTGLAYVEADPDYGVPGSTIYIEGFNFTADEDVEVVLVDRGTGEEREVDEYEADENGEFSGTFRVPAIHSEEYDLVARQEDYYIETNTTFRVDSEGLFVVTLSEDGGPTGSKVTLTGVGFTANKDWSATIGEKTIFESETVEPDGTISGDFYVPTLDVGTYTVTVMDIDTELEVTVDFEVTDKTEAEVDPEVCVPNEYNVTLSGRYFAEKEGCELEFVLYNVTDDGEVDYEEDITDDVYNWSKGFPAAQLDEDGAFEAWWDVYEDDELSIGCYTINVTDCEGLWTQIPFCICAETIYIEPTKDTFFIGDTVQFDIGSSFRMIDSYIKIWTPDDTLYWKTDPFESYGWERVGVITVLPYYQQTAKGNTMILCTDAPLGIWTWTWFDEDWREIDSRTFTVASARVFSLLEEILLKLDQILDNLARERTRLKLIPSTGLEGDENITIEGYGFAENVEIVTITFGGENLATSPETPETDKCGSWSATFTVPDVGGVYDNYTVYAEDKDGNVGTQEFRVRSPVCSLREFDTLFAQNSVRMIYPSDSSEKPLGCGAAWVSDWIASNFVTTKLEDYIEGLDTDIAFVDQITGRALGDEGTGIISFGGQFINPVVKYAESDGTLDMDRAPIKFHLDDVLFRFRYKNGTNIPGAWLPQSVINLDEDMFVIETYKDGSGRYIMLCYGFGWQGTYAAGKYFEREIFPNLALYPYSWTIVKWEDTNGDDFVNNPGYGDNYTLIATSS